MQNFQCKKCKEVTLADGTKVFVCENCGATNEPGEAMVVDATAAQAAVNAATAPTASTEPVAAPAAPVEPAVPPVTPPVEPTV